jgi:hypothetical protein
MQEADEEVGSTEQDRVVSERARHRQRGDQHRRRRGEDGQPHTALVQIERARQPCVDTPRPPQRRQNEHPSENTTPRRVIREQDRHLGHRKDEGKIEKELERCDLMLVARVVYLLDPGHTLTLRKGHSHAGPGEGFLHQLPLCDEFRAESAYHRAHGGARVGL